MWRDFVGRWGAFTLGGGVYMWNWGLRGAEGGERDRKRHKNHGWAVNQFVMETRSVRTYYRWKNLVKENNSWKYEVITWKSKLLINGKVSDTSLWKSQTGKGSMRRNVKFILLMAACWACGLLYITKTGEKPPIKQVRSCLFLDWLILMLLLVITWVRSLILIRISIVHLW